jgi:hypothetical protein
MVATLFGSARDAAFSATGDGAVPKSIANTATAAIKTPIEMTPRLLFTSRPRF